MPAQTRQNANNAGANEAKCELPPCKMLIAYRYCEAIRIVLYTILAENRVDSRESAAAEMTANFRSYLSVICENGWEFPQSLVPVPRARTAVHRYRYLVLYSVLEYLVPVLYWYLVLYTYLVQYE